MRWQGKGKEAGTIVIQWQSRILTDEFRMSALFLGYLCRWIFEYFEFCSSACDTTVFEIHKFVEQVHLKDTRIQIQYNNNTNIGKCNACVSVCECCLSLCLCVGVCVCHAQNNSPLCLSWQGALYRRLRVAT